MKYQKIINLLDNTTNQPLKFRTRNWFETNNESKAKYDSSNTRFKTSMIRSHLCNYSDTYILFKGTMAVPNTVGAWEVVNSTNKKVIFKNYAAFTDCITKINITLVDVAQGIECLFII